MAEAPITLEQARTFAHAGERPLGCTCPNQAVLDDVLAALRAEGLLTRHTVTDMLDGRLFLLAYRMSDKPFEGVA